MPDVNEILIYPNPAGDELIVWRKEFGDNAEITIYSLLGEKLFSQKQETKSQKHVINVSALHSGIYFVEVKSEMHIFRVRFMKM